MEEGRSLGGAPKEGVWQEVAWGGETVRGVLAAGTRLGNAPKVRIRGLEIALSGWPLYQN